MSRHVAVSFCSLASSLLWVSLLFIATRIYALTETSYARRITIGYHRLHSHKAFRAGYLPKLVLALLGASAFQGSIRVRNASLHSHDSAKTFPCRNSGGKPGPLSVDETQLNPFNRTLRHRLHHVCFRHSSSQSLTTYWVCSVLQMIRCTIRRCSSS